MIARLAGFLTGNFGVDPMTRKELYGVSRRWQTYAGRTLYVGILALVLAMMWKSYSDMGRVGYSQYAQIGRTLFTGFAVLQCIMIALAGLGAGADLVSKEVRGDTLGILSMTPLSSWRIVLGKWKAVMANVTMLALAGLPVLSVGIYLGGATGYELLAVFLISLTSGAFCSAFALLCSTNFRSAHAGLVASTLLMAVYGFAPAFMVEMRLWGSSSWDLFEFFAYVHPAYALYYTLGYTFRGGGTTGPSMAQWFSASGMSVAMAFGLLGLAAARLSKLVRKERKRPLLRRFFEWLDGVFERSPLGMKVWRERKDVWDSNPFLWKEMHFRITGKLRYFARIAVVIMLVVVVLTLVIMGDLSWSREFPPIAYSIAMVFFFLACIGAGAGSFAREKEERKWGILLTTPMRPGQFIAAKLGGALTGTLMMVFILCFLVVCTSFVHGRLLVHYLPVVGSTLMFGFFLISVGLLSSLAFPTTRKAYTATLFAALLFLALIPLMLVIMGMWVGGSGTSDLLEFVMKTNPFSQVEALIRPSYWYGYSSWNHGKFWGNFGWAFFVYGGLGHVCLAIARANFNTLARRHV